MTIDAVAEVEKDVIAGLGETFRVGEFRVAPNFREVPMANDAFAAVPWSVTTVHDQTFAGVHSTGSTIEIEGITIVKLPLNDSEAPTFQRYIDWSRVLAQLGVSITGRPVIVDHH